MDDFLFGAVAAAFGLYLLTRRKQFAARTVRQQNSFWRRNWGEREIKQSERAAIIVGIFALALALKIWFT
jgi:hypothetical protein